MKLTILGCHSATPLLNKHTTSQLLEVRGNQFLIDCGEGTQMQLRKYKLRFSRIKHIFISHLHGDHCFGLAGLISTFRLLTRTEPLYIHAPKGLKEVITLQMKLANSWTDYPLIFHELTSTSSEKIYEDDKVEVHTIPLDHRIYTNGFLFKEKPHERKLLPNKAAEHHIDKAYFKKLKQGFDVTNEKGELINNELVTEVGVKPKSYAFCSDTKYNEAILSLIKGVDLLYHEATFLERHAHLTEKTKHSTSKEAAQIAKRAKVEKLVLGHFSTRYNDYNEFIEEASLIFKNTDIAEDGKVFEI